MVADKWRLTAQLKERDGLLVNVGRFLTILKLTRIKKLICHVAPKQTDFEQIRVERKRQRKKEGKKEV